MDPKLPKHGSYQWGTLVHPDPAQFDLRASGYVCCTCWSSSDVSSGLKIRTPNEKNILRIEAVLYESKSGSRHTYPTPNPDITTNGFLKVWWQDATLFVYFSFLYNIHTFIQSHSHSYNTFIHRHLLRPLSISSSLVCSVGNISLRCRAENRTRACLTASRRATNWATPHHKNNKCG